MSGAGQRLTIPPELRQAHLENVTCVLMFLLHAKRDQGPRMMYGSWTVEQALTSFCALAGINKEEAEAKL